MATAFWHIVMPSAGAGHRIRSGYARMGAIVLPNVQNQCRGIYGMARRRQEIEAFVRHLVVEVEAAEAAGMTAPRAIADHFNAKGVTTRKGGRWTARPWPNSSAAWAQSATVRVGKRGAR